MPRQSRIDRTGALHHVIVRGIERRKIFNDDKDGYDFLRRLGTILDETRTPCYAWVLLPDHFHLFLRTGEVPMSTIMRRLLTGHAICYNRRHRRHGHLFQNRYNSILCQEDPYFLELVRYIHLNPIRAGLATNMEQLEKYPFSGHGVLMGKYKQPWHKSSDVLAYFSKQVGSARTKYKSFVSKGIYLGKRTDLTGGGLIRSAGGWCAVQAMRKAKIHMKSDERILGDDKFVAKMLADANESFERGYKLKARGIDLNFIVKKSACLLGMSVKDVLREGRYRPLVTARSLICFWAVRELGLSMAYMGRYFNISTVAVSKSVKRGADIIRKEGYKLIS